MLIEHSNNILLLLKTTVRELLVMAPLNVVLLDHPKDQLVLIPAWAVSGALLLVDQTAVVTTLRLVLDAIDALLAIPVALFLILLLSSLVSFEMLWSLVLRTL